jgi:hypothetical protein
MDDATDFSDFEFHIPRHDDFEVEKPEIETSKGRPLPCNVDDLDLQRPPGFVGRVADWIDSQCRYPRRRLAVASAIVAVGNIGGLRYEDARDNMTANMIAFCVAASSTGKEAVMQAFADLHIASKIQGAVHGAMKSEQEIMRNVIDQQASYYNIDEIGIFLTKVRNAQKGSGGAAYLEGIFGAIMATFSKANSRVLLGGDIKRDLKKVYIAQLSRAKDNGDDEAAEAALQKLRMADQGLERPFLSLIGYTTPSTFDGVMDGETATQGLVGRAIIINEPDINPRPRKSFKKTDLPMTMAGKLWLMTGREDGDEGPVEFRGDRVQVPTNPDADKMLDLILDWLMEYADDANEETGEASVAMVRRAFEMIGKISFILAMPDCERTTEHVRWAFAYVLAELEGKVRLVFANDHAKTRPEEALAARILARLDPDKGVSVSVLANRLKLSADQIGGVLTKLEERGMAVQKISKRMYRGKKIVNWFPVE